MNEVLIIIAPTNFQDLEYSESKKALEEAGFKTVTTSTEKTATGKFGSQITTDTLIKDIDPKDYSAISLIGGPGCYSYFNDKTIHSLAKTFYESGKIVAAICAAPSILANAGILNGKKATCFPSESSNLEEKGATYTGTPVEKDGQIITADGPTSAREYGKMIAESLKIL